MRSDRIMQSKIYRLFDYVLRLVLLNVLIVVPSFSLFIIYSAINKSGNNHLTFLLLIPMLLWLFPSIVATTDVIRQYENKETNTIFKDFFKSIKKLYLKSFIISIFVYLGIGLFWNSLSFFLNNATKGSLYITCSLKDNKYFYNVSYGDDYRILSIDGDEYIINNVDIERATNAKEVINTVTDYFESHNGSCE